LSRSFPSKPKHIIFPLQWNRLTERPPDQVEKSATGSQAEKVHSHSQEQPCTSLLIHAWKTEDPGRKNFEARKWLYQSPEEILIKASDGASDFGNKFGQPLVCGSVLTFEHFEEGKEYGFDKVIMLAGGVGFGKAGDSQKGHLKAGDKIVLLGGDNYRIGMGGGAVSSVATGEYGNAIELNAIQRSNPEMQKRVMNAIRAMVEAGENPIITIHDHGAGGHLNCLSELLEETGGTINVDKLPSVIQRFLIKRSSAMNHRNAWVLASGKKILKR
jgi:phosphoribosylformylglycinamidine (FGAM) synthase-like enzyme